MVPPNLSMCMKGDTLSSPYFFLMGHSKDTVCEKLHVSLSVLINLCSMHSCRHDHEFMHGKIAVCVCVCVCAGVYVCCSKRAVWFEVTLQMRLYPPEEGCEVDCVKSICSGSVCHTTTNMLIVLRHWMDPVCLRGSDVVCRHRGLHGQACVRTYVCMQICLMFIRTWCLIVSLCPSFLVHAGLCSFYLGPPERVFFLPDRLCRPLGFPFYSPLCPAGSDPRTPPQSIALIPSSLSPRLPSSAPSRGHSVHGRQSSTADRPQLH